MMPFNLKGALLSVYDMAFRYFEPQVTRSPYLEIITEPDYPCAIDSLVNTIFRELYRTEARMNELFVPDVRLYKAALPPHSEYVSAKVCAPGGVFVAYVFFKRYRGTTPQSPPSAPEGTDTDAALRPSSGPTNEGESEIYNGASARALARLKPCANDMYGRSARAYRHASDIHCRTLSFSANQLPLWELAVLANCVHENYVEYSADRCFYYNLYSEYPAEGGGRYLYAYAIIQVLENLYRPAVNIFVAESDERDPEKGLGSLDKPSLRSHKDVDIKQLEALFVADKAALKKEVQDQEEKVNQELKAAIERAVEAERVVIEKKLEIEKLRRQLETRRSQATT